MYCSRYAQVPSPACGYGRIPEAADSECAKLGYDTTSFRPKLEEKLIEEELLEQDSVYCHFLLCRHIDTPRVFVWRESWPSLRDQAATQSITTAETNHTYTIVTCDKLGSLNTAVPERLFSPDVRLKIDTFVTDHT